MAIKEPTLQALVRRGRIQLSVKQCSLSGEPIEILILWHMLYGHCTPTIRGQVNTLSLGSLSSPADSRHTNCWRNPLGSRKRREIKADTQKSEWSESASAPENPWKASRNRAEAISRQNLGGERSRNRLCYELNSNPPKNPNLVFNTSYSCLLCASWHALSCNLIAEMNNYKNNNNNNQKMFLAVRLNRPKELCLVSSTEAIWNLNEVKDRWRGSTPLENQPTYLL